MLHGRSLVIFCALFILSLAQPRRALNVRQAEYTIRKSRSRHWLVGDKEMNNLVEIGGKNVIFYLIGPCQDCQAFHTGFDRSFEHRKMYMHFAPQLLRIPSKSNFFSIPNYRNMLPANFPAAMWRIGGAMEFTIRGCLIWSKPVLWTVSRDPRQNDREREEWGVYWLDIFGLNLNKPYLLNKLCFSPWNLHRKHVAWKCEQASAMWLLVTLWHQMFSSSRDLSIEKGTCILWLQKLYSNNEKVKGYPLNNFYDQKLIIGPVDQ